MGSNGQDLCSKLVYYEEEDNRAHTLHSKITNPCDFEILPVAIGNRRYLDVYDDDEQVCDDMHGNHDLVYKFFSQLFLKTDKAVDCQVQNDAGDN